MPDRSYSIGERIIIAIASALGVPASEIRDAYEAIREKRNQTQMEKIREEEQHARFEGVHRRLITDYYASEHQSTELRQYTILLSTRQYPSTIFTTSRRVGLSIPLTSVKTNYIADASAPTYPADFARLSEKQATKVISKLDFLGARIWDQDLFCLAADPFAGDELNLSFSLSTYFHYRFTAGLLEDEVFEALTSSRGQTAAILQNRVSTLPIRNILLPKISHLGNIHNRISAGGLACVVAIARGAPYNDYCIPLQLRSQKVAEGRGVYTGSLQGWHQPTTASPQKEVEIYWSVLRELFEEAFGGEEAEGSSRRLRHDWYLDECPGAAYVHNNHDNSEAVTLEFLGIGMNALTGTYDCAILLAIHDLNYWNTYSSALRRNWEAKHMITLSTRNVSPDLDTRLAEGWLDQGMFGLSQGLLRLRQIDPQRVVLPDLGFKLE
jgi:hypothetical protein